MSPLRRDVLVTYPRNPLALRAMNRYCFFGRRTAEVPALMYKRTQRCLVLALAVVILAAACGDDSETADQDSTVPSTTEGAHQEHSDTTTTLSSDDSATDGHGNAHEHTHGAATTPAVEPYPSVSLRILEDPSGGWLLHSVPTNFRMAPENVSTAHVDGEGHMHLYIDGVKIMRLYGEWHQMPPLAAGTREVRVELSSNDHSAMAVDGVIVDDTVTLEVSKDEATLEPGDSMDTRDSPEHDMSDMDSGESEDADSVDGSDPTQTVSIEIVDGEPVGGHRRVEVDLNSEVALTVASDHAEEVHVHGYDILHAVSPGQPLHFSFTAEIPGVFEVELEGSGRLLLQLTVS